MNIFIYISLSPLSEYLYISSLLTADLQNSLFWWDIERLFDRHTVPQRRIYVRALVRAPFNVASLALHF